MVSRSIRKTLCVCVCVCVCVRACVRACVCVCVCVYRDKYFLLMIKILFNYDEGKEEEEEEQQQQQNQQLTPNMKSRLITVTWNNCRRPAPFVSQNIKARMVTLTWNICRSCPPDSHLKYLATDPLHSRLTYFPETSSILSAVPEILAGDPRLSVEILASDPPRD